MMLEIGGMLSARQYAFAPAVRSIFAYEGINQHAALLV